MNRVAFRESLDQAGLVETYQHSEFRSGLHGFKADFEKAAPVGSKEFEDWVEVTADFIETEYYRPPDVLVSVANGTNELTTRTASRLGAYVIGLETQKDSKNKRLKLTDLAELTLNRYGHEFALILDDVGTTGSNSSQVTDLLRPHFISRIEVLNTIQRSQFLPELDKRGISYRAIYTEVMQNFTPQDCREFGLCAQGVVLRSYAKTSE